MHNIEWKSANSFTYVPNIKPHRNCTHESNTEIFANHLPIVSPQHLDPIELKASQAKQKDGHLCSWVQYKALTGQPLPSQFDQITVV